MMKGIRKGIYLTAAAVLLLAAACTFVFSSSVSVYIKGISVPSSSEQPLVYVYAFLDKESLEAAESHIRDLAEGSDFLNEVKAYEPESCYQRQTASFFSIDSSMLGVKAGGTVADFKIYWESNKPEFGEDADRSKVYFLAVSEVTETYTSTKYIGSTDFTLVSGGSNSTTIQMEVI